MDMADNKSSWKLSAVLIAFNLLSETGRKASAQSTDAKEAEEV